MDAESKITPYSFIYSDPPASDAEPKNVTLMCIPSVWTANHRSVTLIERFTVLSEELQTNIFINAE